MVENLAMFWISTIPTFTISQLCCLVSPHPLLLPFSGIRLYRYQSGLNIVCKICQTHCQKVPKRRWHQARNKQQGIRGNHLGTVTLSYRISGDTYYDRQKCVCVWGGGGGGGGGGVWTGSKSMPQVDLILKATARPHTAGVQNTYALQNAV